MRSDFSIFVSDLWRNRPIVIILLIGGFVIFVLVVIDTYRHRRRLKARKRIKRLH